ncbi:MAG TPA: SRPBCC domain-containing protein [Roseiarcus sp.]|nr:SRPBCC domain-containing protein [Roseiarcus sp.]
MPTDNLVIKRHFRAPPERVFAAFVEKSLMQAWYGPENMTVPHCEVDARVGGKYRVEMHAPSGSVHVLTGEFKEIRPPDRLVYTWGWLNGAGRGPETTVTLTFVGRDGGTDLVLEQSGFVNEDARDRHGHGWQTSLNALEMALEGRPKPQTPAPTILGDYRSTYVRSTRMAFEEKGIAYAVQVARPQSPEILAWNPFGKMPTFRCGELALYETSAILRHLDETMPGPSLMPSDPIERAKVEQWVSVLNCYGYPAIVRNYVLQYAFPRGPDGQPDRSTIDAAIPEIRKILAALDGAIGSRDYLVGDRITLADILLTPMVAYVKAMPEGKDLLAEVPNLRRAVEKLAERPSYVAASQPLAA